MKRVCFGCNVFLHFVLLLVFAPIASGDDGKAAQRIIALSPHSVELLFLLGVGDRIVGTTEFADFPEAAKSIPRIGNYNGIQIDRLIELEPDLVIAWEGGNPAADLERIEELGFSYFSSQTKVLGDIPAEIERYGELVGEQEKAQREAERFRTELQALREKYQNKTPVTFFYQLWSQPLRTMAAGSWINTMFEGCGAQNIFNDSALDYPQVSIESVIEMAPEVIVVPTHHGGEIAIDMWQQWPEIPAIRNEQVLFFDGDLLHRFSYRTLQGMRAVCEALDEVRQKKLAAM